MSGAALLRAGASIFSLWMVCAGARADEGESGSRVSLEEILAHADTHAPRIVVARAELGRGQAAVEGASVVMPANPIIGGGAGPRIFPDGARGVDVQATIQQQVEIAGERRQRRRAADETLQRTKDELEEVRWTVHQEVHAAFHRALVARESRNVAVKLLASTEELLSVAEGRLRAGDISPLAVRLAKGELAQAKQVAVTAHRAYRTSTLDLAMLSGWPPETPPEPAGSLEEPRTPPSVDRLLSLAQEQHPGLKARRQSVKEAEAIKQLEDRRAWPKPRIGVSYAREADPAVIGDEHLVLGQMWLPIPASRRNQAARATARANVAIAEANSDAFHSVLASRLTRAAIAVEADAARIAAYGTEILPAFEGNLALLRRAFELGEVDLLQVVVARERLLKIQRDALAAYQDYYRDVAELEAAVGAEIWPDEHGDHNDDPMGEDGGAP